MNAIDFLPSLGEMPVTLVLCVIIFTICLKFVMDLFRKNPRHVQFAKTLPGPPVVPLFGNGFEFLHKADGSMEILSKYEKKYGSIYRLWFGKHLVIGTTDLDFIEVVFQSSKILDKPPMMESGTQFWDDINVFTAPKPLWKKSRKELQTFFAKNSLSEKMPHINRLVRKYMNKMEEHVDGPQFNVEEFMELLTFDTIVEILLNASLECPEKELLTLSKCFQEADVIMFEKMFKPWLCNAIADFIFYRKKVRDFKEKTTKFFKKVTESQFVSSKPEADNQFISFIELLHKIKDNFGLEERYIQAESIIMIAAGNITTATTASFCLLMLAMHPDVQEKLYVEITEKFGFEDRDLNINELNDLQFLDQVLKETERRFLLVPTIFRYVSEDVEIGPHTIPAGAAIMIATKAIHMSTKYYQNPEKFDPYNHFNPEAVSKRPKLAFFPFSVGARNCLGKALAEIELKLILIKFVRKFRFSTTEKIEDLKPAFGLTTFLDNYMISIQMRDENKMM